MSSKREIASDRPDEFQVRAIPSGFMQSLGRREGFGSKFVRRGGRLAGSMVRGGFQYAIGIGLIYATVCVPGIVQQRLNGKPASDLVASPASAKLAEPVPSTLPSEGDTGRMGATPSALPTTLVVPTQAIPAAKNKSRATKARIGQPKVELNEVQKPSQWVQWR
jgi:hypothetical protein